MSDNEETVESATIHDYYVLSVCIRETVHRPTAIQTSLLVQRLEKTATKIMLERTSRTDQNKDCREQRLEHRLEHRIEQTIVKQRLEHRLQYNRDQNTDYSRKDQNRDWREQTTIGYREQTIVEQTGTQTITDCREQRLQQNRDQSTDRRKD